VHGDICAPVWDIVLTITQRKFQSMENQIPESPYRILARERSHENARQTVATNRMLVQSLIIINGVAATVVLVYYGAHNTSGPGKLAVLLTIIFYCLGVFTAVFAGLYVRRTTQEWSSFWELKSYPDMVERERIMEGHRRQAMKSKGWSTGLLVFSEVFFLAASLCLAMSLG
jgi:hypothetical protein